MAPAKKTANLSGRTTEFLSNRSRLSDRCDARIAYLVRIANKPISVQGACRAACRFCANTCAILAAGKPASPRAKTSHSERQQLRRDHRQRNAVKGNPVKRGGSFTVAQSSATACVVVVFLRSSVISA
jgi:hypothetical protein